MQITKQLFEDVINGKLSGYFELRKGHQVASNMLFRCTSNEEYPYILNDLDSDEGDDLDLYDNNGFAATLGYEYDIVDFFEAPIYEYDDDIYDEGDNMYNEDEDDFYE
jgi:hypothetical protein